MTCAAEVVEATRYAQEYERLRAQINGPAPPPVRGIGLALLLRDGLPAWMRAVRQVLSEAAARAGSAGAALSLRMGPAIALPTTSPTTGEDDGGVPIAPIAPGALVEPARQHDLTTLLANLVLSARQASPRAAMKEHAPCH